MDWGLVSIEQTFYERNAKQAAGGRRLTGMHASIHQIAIPILKAGVMVALAMLVILGLFPVILSAQAASN